MIDLHLHKLTARFLAASTLVAALGCAPSNMNRGATDGNAWGQQIVTSYAYWASGQVHELAKERTSVVSRIQSLPPYAPQMNLSGGFHSAYAEVQDAIRWVQVDLGAELPIHSIALVPAYVRRDDANIVGYGFPKRFRVEVSNDPQFATANVVYEREGIDLPNPGKYPHLIPNLDVRGRYVRLTCTRLESDGDYAFFALGELVVMSGNRNVALWRPVSSSDTVEAELRWSVEYLVDEVSALPLPQLRELSLSDGYQTPPQKDPEVDIDLVIDLQEKQLLDEVRLIPALPLNRPDIPGWGFPRRFRVELVRDLDGSSPIVIYDTGSLDFQHWMNRPIVVPVAARGYFLDEAPRRSLGSNNPPWTLPPEPVEARYIRVHVEKLDDRVSPFYFAIAEVQAYSGDENVALGKPVRVTGVQGVADQEFRWDPQFVTDGFSSRRRLMEWPDWLTALEELRVTEARLLEVDASFSAAVSRVWFWNQWGGIAILLSALGSAAAYNVLLRRRHRKQAEQLRNQIASDLHDDIGSNLGTIGLLCDMIGRGELTEDERVAIQEVREIATETSDAMRDILWIIKPTSTRLEDFLGRIRGIATRMLPDRQVVVDAPVARLEVEIPLTWRRNVFLSIKEALHNAAKHSGCQRVDVSMAVSGGFFDVTIADDGTGFQDSDVGRGFGFSNIKRRIKELGGDVEFRSESGTSVAIHVPLPKRQREE